MRSSSSKVVRIVVNELPPKTNLESMQKVLNLKLNLAGAKGIISVSFKGVLIDIRNRSVNLLVLNNAPTWGGVGRRKRQKVKKVGQISELGLRGGKIQCVYLPVLIDQRVSLQNKASAYGF